MACFVVVHLCEYSVSFTDVAVVAKPAYQRRNPADLIRGVLLMYHGL